MASVKFWVIRIVVIALIAAGVIWFHHERQKRPSRVRLAADKGILLIGNGTEIATLDPHMANGQPEHFIISSLFEGLTAPDAEDPDKNAPGVAQSWETKDFVNWTFKLRPDARWSDGQPVTAEDFIYAWKRILSPELGSDYGDMLHLLKGGADFHTGITKDFSTVGVKAADPFTLLVTLDGPAPYFPGMLKHYAWFPVPRQAIENFGKMTDRDTAWARPGHIVSNGPFILEDWRINHFISVKRNPCYWDAKNVQLNGIHFYAIENAEAEERTFLDDQLHLTKAVPLASVPIYRANPPAWFQQSPELTTEFYRCNVTRAPLDNPKVRNALSLALDRKALTDDIIKSGHLPATGLVPPGITDKYQAPKMARFDPDEARKLLAEAGFPGGKGFRAIKILTNNSDSARTVAEFFQESWHQQLGIEVSILQQDWQVYLDSMSKLQFDVVRGGWVGDYLDPFTFLSVFRSTDGNNNTGWKSSRYDDLMLTSTREPDPAIRLKTMQEAEALLLTDMPMIPIFWRMDSRLKRAEVQNWKESKIGYRCYKAISIGPWEPLPHWP